MASQHPEEFAFNIGAYNDALARVYDDVTREEGWAVNDLIDEAVREHQIEGVRTALDLGAGTGQTVETVERLFHPESIVAVDASARMLEKLEGKLARPGIQTVQGKIEDFVGEQQGKRFDLITAMGSFEFVEDLPCVLGGLATLLSDRGAALFTYIRQTDPAVSERTFQIPSIKTAFAEYYWPEDVIKAVLTSRGLAVATRPPLVAYTRGAEPETVIYDFIVASRLSAAQS